MNTVLTERLGIRHPVLLAPMGNVSGGALAAAVSGAGGLGIVGGGYGDAGWLRRELALCRDAAPFGVGFITWSLDRDPALLDLALDHGPSAVMFSFGDPVPYLRKMRDSGARAICQVQSLAAAEEAADAGADIIVAQGTEAGGHGGARSTFALVPAVVDAVAPVPVVAAGGIVDGRGLAAALMLGACGVLVGTRFVATRESLASPAAKQRIVDTGGDATVRTRVFDIVRGYPWPEHFTGRALRNRFVEAWHGREDVLQQDLPAQQQLYGEAVSREDFDTAVVFAGEAVDVIRSIEPAAEVVRRMAEDAEQRLRSGPAPR